MEHVFLVTSKDKYIKYGDSLFVEGVFKTNKLAEEYVDSTFVDKIREATITKMKIGDANGVNYPGAFYEE